MSPHLFPHSRSNKMETPTTPVRFIFVVLVGIFEAMLQLIFVLLVIWLVLTVLGFVVKGLVWLAIVGIVLFLATAAWGFIKRETLGRRR